MNHLREKLKVSCPTYCWPFLSVFSETMRNNRELNWYWFYPINVRFTQRKWVNASLVPTLGRCVWSVRNIAFYYVPISKPFSNRRASCSPVLNHFVFLFFSIFPLFCSKTIVATEIAGLTVICQPLLGNLFPVNSSQKVVCCCHPLRNGAPHIQ